MEYKKWIKSRNTFDAANDPYVVILFLDSHVNSKNPFARCHRLDRDTFKTASIAKSLSARRFLLSFYRSASVDLALSPTENASKVVHFFCWHFHIFFFMMVYSLSPSIFRYNWISFHFYSINICASLWILKERFYYVSNIITIYFHFIFVIAYFLLLSFSLAYLFNVYAKKKKHKKYP